jgi:hypothetical protein
MTCHQHIGEQLKTGPTLRAYAMEHLLYMHHAGLYLHSRVQQVHVMLQSELTPALLCCPMPYHCPLTHSMICAGTWSFCGMVQGIETLTLTAQPGMKWCAVLTTHQMSIVAIFQPTPGLVHMLSCCMYTDLMQVHGASTGWCKALAARPAVHRLATSAQDSCRQQRQRAGVLHLSCRTATTSMAQDQDRWQPAK